MAFETILVALAASLMTWVIQTQNGGVLNVLFNPDPVSELENKTFSVVYKVDYKYFIDLLLLKPLNFPVLRAIPEQFGGGQKGVDAANVNPNREPILFWAVIATSLLLTLLLICATCCCGSGPTNGEHAITTKGKLARHQKIRQSYHTILVIFALSMALITTCFFALYFGTVDFAFTASEQASDGKVQSINMLERIQMAIDEIKNFTREGSAAFPDSVNRSLTDFENRINSKLSTMLPEIVDNLLTNLKLLSIRDSGVKVAESMTEILSDARKELGTFNKIKEDLVDLETKLAISKIHFKIFFEDVVNCSTTENCSDLKELAVNLELPVNLSQIDENKLQATLDQLEKLQKKLGNIVDIYISALVHFDVMLKSAPKFVMDKFNLKQITEMAHDFAITMESRVNNTLTSIQTSFNSTSSQIRKYTEWTIIVFYSVGVFIGLLILTAILLILRLIYLACRGNIFSYQVMSPSKRTTVCSEKRSVCCCSAILIHFLLLSSVLVAVIFLGLTIVAGEGCIYVTDKEAMKKTDVVLNGIIAAQWDLIVRSEKTNFLTKAPPSDILQALANRCEEDSVGLLFACNIRNLINLTEVAHRPEVKETISRGRELLISAVKVMPISSMTPLKKEFEKLAKDLPDAFERLNNILPVLLRYSDPSLIDNTSIENLILKLKAFNTTVLAPQQREFEAGVKVLEEINSLLPTLMSNVNECRTGVESVVKKATNLRPQLSDLLQVLLDSIRVISNESLLELEVISQYNVSAIHLLQFLETDGFHIFQNLTQELFPCQKAHRAYKAAMSVTCDPSGVINHAIGFITITAFTILFLTLFYVAFFTLASYQASEVQMLENSPYTNHNTFIHPIMEAFEQSNMRTFN
nr:hypothetical protein HmN_000624900 [Hymenolepis microstoma]